MGYTIHPGTWVSTSSGIFRLREVSRPVIVPQIITSGLIRHASLQSAYVLLRVGVNQSKIRTPPHIDKNEQ